MSPTVSVLTIAYNHGRFIEKCLRSVQTQTFHDWEQIIIDDGSSDDTVQRVQPFLIDRRIRYVRQDHVGIGRLAESYNKALGMAKGEYVAVLEGDDYYPRNKFEVQLPFFDSSTVLTWGLMKKVDAFGSLLEVFPKFDFSSIDDKKFRRMMLHGCYVPAVSVMCRRNVLVAAGGFSQGACYVDYPTWLKLLPLGRFRFVKKVLGCWTIHGDNSSFVFRSVARPDLDALEAYASWPESFREDVGSLLRLRWYWKLLRMRQFLRRLIRDGW
jgi:glycosyltransferase involved in cell wall biosynthesis